jgi:hypothetical protein
VGRRSIDEPGDGGCHDHHTDPNEPTPTTKEARFSYEGFNVEDVHHRWAL